MKVGVALGGGGVRGIAHILALEVIDACGITPAVISGTSMGSIIGALYASGKSGREIRELINRHTITSDDKLKDIYRKKSDLIKWIKVISPSWSRSGLLKADVFLQYLLESISVETFEELKIPFDVVATDFNRGTPAIFNTGDLMPAIMASMSIPGVFVPVEHNGKVLVDGGVVNNLPYDLLQDRCDITIAIDVPSTREEYETKPPNIIDATIGMFDILIEQVTKLMLEHNPPTIYIRPKLVGIRTLDFDKIKMVFEQSQPAMDELKIKIEQIINKTAELSS
jgi:NTE family protein